MALIKIFFKLLVLPIIAAVTLIQWVGIFLTQFSTVIFNLLAGLMFLIAVAGFMVRHWHRSRNAPNADGCLCGLYHPPTLPNG